VLRARCLVAAQSAASRQKSTPLSRRSNKVRPLTACPPPAKFAGIGHARRPVIVGAGLRAARLAFVQAAGHACPPPWLRHALAIARENRSLLAAAWAAQALAGQRRAPPISAGAQIARPLASLIAPCRPAGRKPAGLWSRSGSSCPPLGPSSCARLAASCSILPLASREIVESSLSGAVRSSRCS
jgi:hypothetical protein